jgi:hypothetical protein
MSRYLRIPAACLVLGLALASDRALAYNIASEISYSTSSGVLSGYARTWKDWWEADYSDTCYYMEWSDTFGWFCIWWGMYYYYVDAWAQAYTPLGNPYGGAEMFAWRDAQAAYSFSQPLLGGVWTGRGEHYLPVVYIELFCDSYYGVCYLVYYSEDWYHLGSTSGEAAVPTTIPLDISRYSTTSLTEAEVDSYILPEATEVLQTNDGGYDVSCPIAFQRSGAISVFTDGDGSVDDQVELEAVMAVPGRVQAVNEINWCGGEPAPPSTVGCGSGLGMIVERNPSLEGMLWAHEYGHNQYLTHHDGDPSNLMYPSLVPSARSVTQFQCDAMRNPLN